MTDLVGPRAAGMAEVAARRPPGSYGPPVLGFVYGLLDFFLLSGWEGFFAKRRRRHGSTVFKVHLFKPTIAMLDEPAIAALFASGDLVQDYGFSWAVPPPPLVGGIVPSIFEHGPAHDGPKAFYLSLLRARSATLVASFDRVANEFVAHWTARSAFAFRDELEDFAVALVYDWMLGLRPAAADVRTLYNGLFGHIGWQLTRHVPGSPFRRALAIYERLLADVEAAPRMPELLALAAEAQQHDAGAVARQLAFAVGMNSYLGVQVLLKTAVGELGARPELRELLRREIADRLPARGAPLALSQLGSATLPLLDQTLREVLRLHPPVSFVFGRATQDRTIDSSSGRFAIARGELLMGVIPFAQRDPAVYHEPDAFDAARFADAGASAHLVWPRGLHDASVTPVDRTCPGKDVAVLIAKLFCVRLLRDHDWTPEEAEPRWRRRVFVLDAAAPVGKMAVTAFRRRD